MNIDELWIGDDVLIKASQKKGKFIGKAKDGRARISYNTKILLVSPKNLELITENEKVEIDLKLEDITSSKSHVAFNPELDLHIDRLNPSLSNALPQMILKHQMDRCQAFIQEAIDRNIKILLIIHGKGTGQLRREVQHLLSQYEEFRHSILVNDGGASQVWLK